MPARKAAEKPAKRAAKAPAPPAGLGASGEALWERAWALRQVEEGDRPSLERLCFLEDQAASLRAELERYGVMLKRPIQNARGELIGAEAYPSPALAALRKIGDEHAALCEALGFSPSGRRDLGMIVSERPKDNVDDLKRRRAERRGKMAAATAARRKAAGEG